MAEYVASNLNNISIKGIYLLKKSETKRAMNYVNTTFP